MYDARRLCKFQRNLMTKILKKDDTQKHKYYIQIGIKFFREMSLQLGKENSPKSKFFYHFFGKSEQQFIQKYP